MQHSSTKLSALYNIAYTHEHTAKQNGRSSESERTKWKDVERNEPKQQRQYNNIPCTEEKKT